MAAWFLIARFLLLYVLSDVNYSSAFPAATSPVQPGAWQGGRGEHDVYGNPRPFQYMRALWPADPKIYPNVRYQVQVQSPRSYQPRSNIPAHRPMETYPLQPRAHRDHLVAKPRSFDLSLKIPYARYGANPPRYGPSGLIIDNSFNKPGRLHDPSKLGYQFSLAVPFSRGSPRRQQHHGGHQQPEEDDLGHRRPPVYVPSHTRPHPDEYPDHRDEGRPGRDSAFLESDGLERPSGPRPDEHHRDEGRPGRDSAFLEPDGLERPSRPRHPQRYVHPYSGYYNSHMNPKWNDYWWYYHGPHWGQVKQQSSDPWPNFHRSASD